MYYYEKYFNFLRCTIFLAECATTSLGVKRTPIPEKLDNIKQGEGIIVFGADASIGIDRVEVSAEGKNHNLFFSDGFILSAMTEGTYEIKKVFFSSYRYFETSGSAWSFKVEKGKINYVGHIRIKSLKHQQFLLDITNRASFFYEYMEHHHSELTTRYPIIYSNLFSDNFLI
ncbi:hypothetical protein [Pleionea sp. CnH1-48]|uniref:hypothetical protein n=1 Tax=Pleionea sp. CnH1-48 TaxID=2954494 RepID=UPI002096D596|nr:hypothetical protein [Pleionea sp. CnH1-48]MCO7224330.1 hypothetical protein [Pleionea sp. CnH1-48]